jgi:tol-pal system protein YbgF
MRRLLCAAAAVALTGCWVPAERGRQMERRIDRLEEEGQITTRQLEEQRELLRERVAKADAKIAEVQKKLDELNATAHRSGADVVARQDQLQQDLAQVRGQLEESQHRLQLMEQQLGQSKQESDAKFAALRGAGALEQFEARRKIEQLKKPSDPQPFLALAREQDRAGEKAVARELYDELSKRWPKDPAAADAQYRLGELAAQDGKHREAILAFGKVAQEYPRSERAPDAMLQTAESLVALNMRDEAVGVLRELGQKYPGTSAAKAARTRLDQLAPATKVQIGPKKAPPKKKQ